MEKEFLQDWKNWKGLNKDKYFTVYDYIYHNLNNQNINSDIFFTFIELVWPTFFQLDGHIFLKENFSLKKYESLKRENENVEFWLNLILLSPYFENDNFEEQKSQSFSQKLVEIWQVKLKKDFPNLNFIVEYVFDSENSDHGLTFYQISQDV